MAMRNRMLGSVPMEPGERDRLVTIEQLTESRGASGVPLEQWSAIGDLFAGRFDDRGTEQYTNSQISAVAITRWEIGYRADCDPELIDVAKQRRINDGGRIYDILAGSLIGRREGIEFTVRAKVG
jgi:head-tail adaptor